MRNWFARLLNRNSTTITTAQQLHEYLVRQHGESWTGQAVTAESAIQISTVYSCVRVISQSIAALPLYLMREENDGDQLMQRDHPLFPLLFRRPNPWTTAYRFWSAAAAHVVLLGNAYVFINRGSRGQVLELQLLDPGCVEIVDETLDPSRVRYRVTFADRRTVTLERDDVMHLRGLQWSGPRGLSVVGAQRETLAAAIAQRQHGNRVFKHGASLGLVFKHPQVLSDTARERLKTSLDDYAGAANAGKTLVIEEGMDVKTVSMPLEDAQFIENQQFSRAEICGLFGVPPHKIGDLERATFANIEEQNIDFVTSTLAPWLVSFEDEISISLLTDSEQRQGLSPRFDTSGLLMGSFKTRQEGLAIMRQNGALSVNEWRRIERRNRIEGGDEYTPAANLYGDSVRAEGDLGNEA